MKSKTLRTLVVKPKNIRPKKSKPATHKGPMTTAVKQKMQAKAALTRAKNKAAGKVRKKPDRSKTVGKKHAKVATKVARKAHTVTHVKPAQRPKTYNVKKATRTWTRRVKYSGPA